MESRPAHQELNLMNQEPSPDNHGTNCSTTAGTESRQPDTFTRQPWNKVQAGNPGNQELSLGNQEEPSPDNHGPKSRQSWNHAQGIWSKSTQPGTFTRQPGSFTSPLMEPSPQNQKVNTGNQKLSLGNHGTKSRQSESESRQPGTFAKEAWSKSRPPGTISRQPCNE